MTKLGPYSDTCLLSPLARVPGILHITVNLQWIQKTGSGAVIAIAPVLLMTSDQISKGSRRKHAIDTRNYGLWIVRRSFSLS